MKPSAVIILMLVVAVVVAFLSNNLGLAALLIPALLLGLVTKLLRSRVQAPGELKPRR
jgi:uncharacterized membrane protein YoaK (UPF0700 family)